MNIVLPIKENYKQVKQRTHNFPLPQGVAILNYIIDILKYIFGYMYQKYAVYRLFNLLFFSFSVLWASSYSLNFC